MKKEYLVSFGLEMDDKTYAETSKEFGLPDVQDEKVTANNPKAALKLFFKTHNCKHMCAKTKDLTRQVYIVRLADDSSEWDGFKLRGLKWDENFTRLEKK